MHFNTFNECLRLSHIVQAVYLVNRQNLEQTLLESHYQTSKHTAYGSDIMQILDGLIQGKETS